MGEAMPLQVNGQTFSIQELGLPGAVLLRLIPVASQTGNVFEILNPTGGKGFTVDVNGAIATLANLNLSTSAVVAWGATPTITTATTMTRGLPAAARTGAILTAGTVDGQLCIVENQAVASLGVTFDVAGTSNVADGIKCTIPGLSSKMFIWDAAKALWYSMGDTAGQSLTAFAIGASGTVPTYPSVARLNPAAARTGCIMAVGVYEGQRCTVINEAVAALGVTFDVSGTSNVADGIKCTIPGLSSKTFNWDAGTSLWYAEGEQAGQSLTAVAIASSGTVATYAAVSRLNPAAAVTGLIMAVGVYEGQICTVVNEAAVGFTAAFAVQATSNVADGASKPISGLSSRTFVWDAAQSLWFSMGGQGITNVISGVGATRTLLAGETGSTCLFDSAAGNIYTLPVPVPGMYFDFIQTVTVTSNAAEVDTDAGTTFILGSVVNVKTDLTTLFALANGTTHVEISSNGSTTGGILGSQYRLTAITTTLWNITGYVLGSGAIATPFST